MAEFGDCNESRSRSPFNYNNFIVNLAASLMSISVVKSTQRILLLLHTHAIHNIADLPFTQRDVHVGYATGPMSQKTGHP